jgi:hypothetical protein
LLKQFSFEVLMGALKKGTSEKIFVTHRFDIIIIFRKLEQNVLT